jgi:hypothetical protein
MMEISQHRGENLALVSVTSGRPDLSSFKTPIQIATENLTFQHSVNHYSLIHLGTNVITCYATTIFIESLSFQNHEASVLAVGLLTWKIVAAALAYYYVDRAGRKPLFMLFGAGMGTSMLCQAVSVGLLKHPGAGAAATVGTTVLL